MLLECSKILDNYALACTMLCMAMHTNPPEMGKGLFCRCVLIQTAELAGATSCRYTHAAHEGLPWLLVGHLGALLMSVLVAIEGDVSIELAVMLLQHLICSLLVNDSPCIPTKPDMARWMRSRQEAASSKPAL